MIEVSERKYWKILNYYDALLYCSILDIDGKNDWRMIKNDREFNQYLVSHPNVSLPDGWFIKDEKKENSKYLNNNKRYIIPVRDL